MAFQKLIFALCMAASIANASVLNRRQQKLEPAPTLGAPPPLGSAPSLSAAPPLGTAPPLGAPPALGAPSQATKPPNRFPHEVANCNRWHEVRPGHACIVIVEMYEKDRLTLTDLYKWNPDINSACSNLMPGDNVCIGVGALAPVPTQPTPDPVPQPPKPKPYPAMPGVTGKCTKFYQIVENDVCIGITEKFDIGLNDFMSWNSGVSPDCKNLWVGYYVCVGV